MVLRTSSIQTFANYYHGRPIDRIFELYLSLIALPIIPLVCLFGTRDNVIDTPERTDETKNGVR